MPIFAILCLFVAITACLGLAFALSGHYDARLLLGFFSAQETESLCLVISFAAGSQKKASCRE
jgi:hypothetical protein